MMRVTDVVSRLILMVLLAGWLGGCATVDRGTAPEKAPGGITEPAPRTGESPRSGATPSQPPPSAGAVEELAAKAETASRQGNQPQAAALLERALRIEPRNAALWQNLAVVHYRQNRNEQAESMALRSNSLAGDDRELKRQNWALIAETRRQRGDSRGVKAAEAQVRALAPR